MGTVPGTRPAAHPQAELPGPGFALEISARRYRLCHHAHLPRQGQRCHEQLRTSAAGAYSLTEQEASGPCRPPRNPRGAVQMQPWPEPVSVRRRQRSLQAPRPRAPCCRGSRGSAGRMAPVPQAETSETVCWLPGAQEGGAQPGATAAPLLPAGSTAGGHGAGRLGPRGARSA